MALVTYVVEKKRQIPMDARLECIERDKTVLRNDIVDVAGVQ